MQNMDVLSAFINLFFPLPEISTISLIFAFFFLLCYGDKERFRNTDLKYEGLWERRTLFRMYIPFVYRAVCGLSQVSEAPDVLEKEPFLSSSLSGEGDKRPVFSSAIMYDMFRCKFLPAADCFLRPVPVSIYIFS